MNEDRFAWFAAGWLALGFLYWFLQGARNYLRKRSPCEKCNGDGFKVERPT